MQVDKLKFTGELTIRRTNGLTGELLEECVVKNLVVSGGIDWIMERIADDSQAAMSHMAVGSGNTAAAPGDTALQTEITRTALVSATPNGHQVTYVGSFPAGVGTGALEEAGILNAGAAGTMLARTVFPVVNKGANDGISITWVITASVAVHNP